MLKLYHFVKYIKPYNESVKDYLKPKSEEQIKNIISNMDDNSKFANAIRYGIIDMMLEISDKYQNVGVINTIIDTSCKKGYYKAIDELLKRDYFLKVIKSDDIYNSLYTTSHNNVLLEHITEAIKKGHLDIAERMLNDKNIIQLLSEEDIEMLGDYLYLSKKAKEKNISLNKNESVKDYLKPKSKEDILKSADNLERFEKLQVGSEYGVLYLVKKAVEMGINPGMDNNRAIRIAAKNGHYDVVEYLLSLKDKRVDPNHDDSITIKLASHNGHYDIVKLLLNDERVKNSEYIKKIHTLVNKDDRTESWNIDSILKTLKYINEAKVSDFLKPKSKEEIKGKLESLPIGERIDKIVRYKLYSDKEIRELIDSLSKSELVSVLKKPYSNYNMISKYISTEKMQEVYSFITDAYETIKKSPFWKIKGLRDWGALHYAEDSRLGKVNYYGHESYFEINISNSKIEDHVTIKIVERIDDEKYITFSRHASGMKYVKDIEELFNVLSSDTRVPEPVRKYFKLENLAIHHNINKIEKFMKDKRRELEEYDRRKNMFDLDESVKDYHVVESIKDYLKPKSTEDIKKFITKLSGKELYFKLFDIGRSNLMDFFSKTEYEELLSKLSKWDRGYLNTKLFEYQSIFGKSYLQGCRHCDKIVPLNYTEDRQQIGNASQTLCKCAECGEYIIFDDNKSRALEIYLSKNNI